MRLRIFPVIGFISSNCTLRPCGHEPARIDYTESILDSQTGVSLLKGVTRAMYQRTVRRLLARRTRLESEVKENTRPLGYSFLYCKTVSRDQSLRGGTVVFGRDPLQGHRFLTAIDA